jgi:quinol monooxygenase YgiN
VTIQQKFNHTVDFINLICDSQSTDCRRHAETHGRDTRTQRTEPLPPFLAEPSRIGREISITGKWVPTKQGGRFRRSAESKEMLQEWEDIHVGARTDAGVLSTEINHAVGEDAVLVHHVFKDPDALVHYFSTTATQHMGALAGVAEPQLHLIRGANIPTAVREAVLAKNVPAVFGELLFGYVKEDYKRPDQETAIMVTAKWTCTAGGADSLEDLKYWWQRVGTEAHTIEEGLLRFEAYQVVGEDALIIHETFENSDELKFHLSKGTAEKYKKDIDKVASPEAYFFRGPVSWTIRTYSKFLHLPATYSSHGSSFTRPGGSMSDGTPS